MNDRELLVNLSEAYHESAKERNDMELMKISRRLFIEAYEAFNREGV